MTLYKIKNITRGSKTKTPQQNMKRDKSVTLERKERKSGFFYDFWASSHQYVRGRSSFGKIYHIILNIRRNFFRIRVHWKIGKTVKMQFIGFIIIHFYLQALWWKRFSPMRLSEFSEFCYRSTKKCLKIVWKYVIYLSRCDIDLRPLTLPIKSYKQKFLFLLMYWAGWENPNCFNGLQSHSLRQA